jgi:hypothetical protein
VTKVCNKCAAELALGVNWTKGRKKVYINMCSGCYASRQRRYSTERSKAPAALRKQKSYRVLRKYGVSMDVYEKRIASRDTCEICLCPPHNTRPLVYDHCHTTGNFRGVLCDSCNTAIGKLGDTAEGVSRAVKHLSRQRNPHGE